ncbi:FabA/FabZ family ACP-dehydratase [Rhodoferax saidenbachensis]|uniref:3-hydroxyacyl-[acyl-carrier-protein] dehydratase n=1 Tax=Rhodoferax saidenbachensis TaxID=1484693 RepID=A0ABU1ZKN1_9BURK|nr:FabA/FabZ family ACP-dehydratase [Rhodoferax saidenbachensis]MDR7306111.1 3-hydroxyacyl-[acyl-carrier-protein] dehydratase [Rhodoferax saidenbachensis]
MRLPIPEFPFTLDRQAIESLLPHRGPIFACRQLIARGPRTYSATAHWALDNALIQGHFPGYPLVPGVMLIESVTQLAGAGLLSADAYVQSLSGDRIGILASVRRCSFKRPVLPEQDVNFEITCRQIGDAAVQINAQALVEGLEVAQLETLMVYADRSQFSVSMR